MALFLIVRILGDWASSAPLFRTLSYCRSIKTCNNFLPRLYISVYFMMMLCGRCLRLSRICQGSDSLKTLYSSLFLKSFLSSAVFRIARKQWAIYTYEVQYINIKSAFRPFTSSSRPPPLSQHVHHLAFLFSRPPSCSIVNFCGAESPLRQHDFYEYTNS